MSIMQKQRSRDPAAGYARDFTGLMERIFPACVERGVKVVTNAGGVNPSGVRQGGGRSGAEGGGGGARPGRGGRRRRPHGPPRRAARRPDIRCATWTPASPCSPIRDRVRSANVYLGARPIVEALVRRCARRGDGPLHRHGADLRASDARVRLVPGRLRPAGQRRGGGPHQRMRGAGERRQLSRGMVGHPGSPPKWASRSSRRPRTGLSPSRSTRNSVARSPCARSRSRSSTRWATPSTYITPDVTADFTTIRLSDEGPDRVGVRGIRGRPPTPFLKVSIAHAGGLQGGRNAGVCVAGRGGEGACRRGGF